MKKGKTGFTLAEVLITLAVIGIVAVMTIPTILSNFRQKTLKTQFKKSYATIKQAIERTKSEFGYTPLCYYKYTAGGDRYKSDCDEFFDIFFAQFNIAKYCKDNAFQGGCIPDYKGYDTILEEKHKNDEDYTEGEWADFARHYCYFITEDAVKKGNPAYVLNDGTILLRAKDYPQPVLIVDINGFKGPNKFGQDLFGIFMVGENFKLEDPVCAGLESEGYNRFESMLK